MRRARALSGFALGHEHVIRHVPGGRRKLTPIGASPIDGDHLLARATISQSTIGDHPHAGAMRKRGLQERELLLAFAADHQQIRVRGRIGHFVHKPQRVIEQRGSGAELLTRAAG